MSAGNPGTDIPVQCVSTSEPRAGGPAVAALLHEIESLLTELVESGTRHCIDLRRTPLTVAERVELERTLGSGEVHATLDLLGTTRVDETSVPGVWWIRHLNAEGDTVGELVEITPCPELLVTDAADLARGLDRLRTRIGEHTTRAPDPRDIAASLAALGIEPPARPSDLPHNAPHRSTGHAG